MAFTPRFRLLIVASLSWSVVDQALMLTRAPWLVEQHLGQDTGLIFLGFVVFFTVGVAWTRALWNTVVPGIIGWRTISYREAFAVHLFFLPLEFGVSSKLSALRPPDNYYALQIGGALVVLAMVHVMWTRALWNRLIARGTGCRPISSWEAAGVTALAFFVL
jgi:hypothetical protein